MRSRRLLALVAAAVSVLSMALLAGCGRGSGTTASSGPRKRPRSDHASTTTTLPPTLSATLTPWGLPAPVSRPVVLDEGGNIVVLGGLTTGDVSTDSILAIDPATGTTGPGGTLEEAVHDAAGAVLDGTAYVFGGGSYTTLSAVQAWKPGTTAATVVGSLPVARSDLAAVVVDGTAYVLGGFDGTAMTGAILATQDGVHFKVVGELPQAIRYPGVAVDSSGQIWIVGGELGTSEDADLGGNTDAIQRFDPATGVASVVGHLPEGLGHDEAMFLGGQLFVTGGRTDTAASSAIWRIDTVTGAVTQAGSLPGPRSDAGAVVIDGVGYLVGGEVTGPESPLSSVVELRLVRQ